MKLKFKKNVKSDAVVTTIIYYTQRRVGCSISVTMSILQHFRKIQRIFYLFGIAPWSNCSDNLKQKNCFRRLPVLISLISSICVAVLQFLSFYLESYGLINRLVNYAFFGCVLFANATANFQCWFYESIYQNLINGIRRWESDFNFKFSRKISYKLMRSRYATNAVLIIGFFSISAATVVGQAWFVGSNGTRAVVLASFTTIKELMCSLAVFHFTLYVDIVTLFTASINKQIRRSHGCFYPSAKVALLKDVKSMHMDLFLLMKQVNGFFGWHLLVLMIHYLILITYSMYWMFLTIQTTGKVYSIVGKAPSTFMYRS